jgi:hypothetical protein
LWKIIKYIIINNINWFLKDNVKIFLKYFLRPVGPTFSVFSICFKFWHLQKILGFFGEIGSPEG